MSRLAEVVGDLRLTAGRYGGIAELQEGANMLDGAVTAFMSALDEGTLLALVGAHANAVRLRSWTAAEHKTGPEVMK